jgi:hypothetical protein
LVDGDRRYLQESICGNGYAGFVPDWGNACAMQYRNQLQNNEFQMESDGGETDWILQYMERIVFCISHGKSISGLVL